MEENVFKVWRFADATEADTEIIKRFSKNESGGGASDPKAISYEPHAKNIAAFIKAIEERRPFEIDRAEAKKAVEIILAIYKSAKENKSCLPDNESTR